MRIEWWALAVVLATACGVMLSAEQPQQCEPSPLPANIDVPSHLRAVLVRLYRQSPTFRAQCERVARAPHMRVSIRLSTTLPSECRALTQIRRQGHSIFAEMQLPPSASLVELLGHEFEHLLEQIDGLNLQRLARVRGSGVWETGRRFFETDRAIAAGRIVAHEWREPEPAN